MNSTQQIVGGCTVWTVETFPSGSPKLMVVSELGRLLGVVRVNGKTKDYHATCYDGSPASPDRGRVYLNVAVSDLQRGTYVKP